LGIAESESPEMDYSLFESSELRDTLYNESRNSWEYNKHPYLILICVEVMVLLIIGLGIWMMGFDATQVIEQEGSGFIMGLAFVIVGVGFAGAYNVFIFIQIRRYGIYGALRPTAILGNRGVLYDPIEEEPVLLIKLRDPRVALRLECLMKILKLWEEEEFRGAHAYKDFYVKRLTFCLIDKNARIRRIACEILHKHFEEYLPVIVELLQSRLDLNYYLVDRSLKTRLKEEPIQKIRFCGNLECFQSDEPCKSWPVSQTILPKLEPSVDSLAPIAHCTSFQLESVNHLDKGQIIGICRVCNLPLYDSEEAEKCPVCGSSMHKSHFLEWLKIKGYCPACSKKITNSEKSGLYC